MSTHIDGESYNYGFLEDYAFFSYIGLLTLYQATEDKNLFGNKQKKLKDDMVRLFWDEEGGGFYYYSHISEQLILRPKDFYDGGAIPSGNSFAALGLQNYLI